MSAFICTTTHVKALAIFAASTCGPSVNVDPRYLKGWIGSTERAGAKLAAAYANILHAQNVRSVNVRYSADEAADVIRVTEREFATSVRAQPVQILKACDCLEYQSCETKDWKDTLACALVSEIRRAAIRQLPGYAGARWSIED